MRVSQIIKQTFSEDVRADTKREGSIEGRHELVLPSLQTSALNFLKIVDKTRWNQGPKALEEAESSVGIRTSRELNISPSIEKSSGHMELMRVHFQLEEKTRMAYSIHFQWEVKVHGFPQPSCKISSDRLPHSSETLVNATSAEKILSRTWISEYIVRNALCLVKKLQDAPRTEVKEYPIRSTREIQERPTACHHHWRRRPKPGRSTLE